MIFFGILSLLRGRRCCFASGGCAGRLCWSSFILLRLLLLCIKEMHRSALLIFFHFLEVTKNSTWKPSQQNPWSLLWIPGKCDAALHQGDVQVGSADLLSLSWGYCCFASRKCTGRLCWSRIRCSAAWANRSERMGGKQICQKHYGNMCLGKAYPNHLNHYGNKRLGKSMSIPLWEQLFGETSPTHYGKMCFETIMGTGV